MISKIFLDAPTKKLFDINERAKAPFDENTKIRNRMVVNFPENLLENYPFLYSVHTFLIDSTQNILGL